MGMGSGDFTVFFLVLCASLIHGSSGAVYKVGDSVGWTTIGHFDYKKWAATKSFQIGDVVVFGYNPQFHNVMQVTHPHFQSCNTSSPIATYTTGNDSITITRQGHHLFLCGVPGHCQSGQKVDINVLSNKLAPSPSEAPVSPSPAATTAPAPSPSHAALQFSSMRLLGSLGMAVAVLGALVSSAV